MQTLRHAPHLVRLVLVWFVLSLGAAVAAPVLQPQGMSLVCSANGAIQWVANGDSDEAPAQTRANEHVLNCPVCVPMDAPPASAPAAILAHLPTAGTRLPAAIAGPVLSVLAAPLPARGPPRA